MINSRLRMRFSSGVMFSAMAILPSWFTAGSLGQNREQYASPNDLPFLHFIKRKIAKSALMC
jgi:hypothetical protein